MKGLEETDVRVPGPGNGTLSDPARRHALLQKPVQLLLDAGKRILPHVINASLFPFSPFFFGIQLLHLFFDGNLGNGDGQVNLGNTNPQEMVSEDA